MTAASGYRSIFRPGLYAGQTVIVFVTGGNVAPEAFMTLLAEAC